MMIDSIKLILLPVRIAHYQVEDRSYDGVIDGQKGKVRGEQANGVVGKFFS